MPDKSSTYGIITLLGDEQAWTPSFYLRSFDMDSVQVGKAVFVKENYTTLGIEPRTYSYPGRLVNHPSVCSFKKNYNLLRHDDITLVLISTTARTALPSQPPMTATSIPSVKSVRPFRCELNKFCQKNSVQYHSISIYKLCRAFEDHS